ncbi:hypothetical protein SSP24_06190 [Streptomyces spinoverrucosus]|uniref:Uncharacterized protein n=1 Tax=Streptomyces spinoverrucosus TaxID=284043 RepID=A0A4Y3V800_9ACTN|nr:hypothetical protein [Streptomyces spinoverrucosus]GEC02964.1 hypothetical protein SSP24_06190 [Streptomyces spinoverrucosus]GHB39246.1 hypothetical protein GCM10010397_06400 [Streptomyces spinoverrucosus]
MDRWDVLALLGIVLLGTGLWLIAPWLGLTVGGAVLLGVGLCGSVLAERAAVRQELIDATKGGA